MSESFSFELIKQSKRSAARVGILHTPHGDVHTPSFVPVATRGSIRTLDMKEVADLGSQLVISNTYHLSISPGKDILKKAGGIHKYMGWDKPVFTDSGGFQVFSLGFGTDHGMGKILQEETQKNITTGTESQKVKIKEEGVSFRSPKDGSQLFLSPEISIDLQEHIGADVMFAFDECPSPLSTYEYMKDSIARTHRWAERCLAARTTDQALYGIVQGGSFPDLRRESAQILGAMSERGGFNGFGIGGEFGYDKASLRDNTLAATSNLPAHLPRHLLGVGHPEDFDYIAEGGADTFDCIAPTHYARHGTAFTSVGRIDLTKASMLEDLTPIDPSCTCPTCSTYTRSYVSHLIKSHEHTGIKLATVHNVHYFNMLAKRLRERILNDEL